MIDWPLGLQRYGDVPAGRSLLHIARTRTRAAVFLGEVSTWKAQRRAQSCVSPIRVGLLQRKRLSVRLIRSIIDSSPFWTIMSNQRSVIHYTCLRRYYISTALIPVFFWSTFFGSCAASFKRPLLSVDMSACLSVSLSVCWQLFLMINVSDNKRFRSSCPMESI